MKLTTLGSSSSGNCYILEIDNQILILEAGINIKYLNKVLKFDYSKVKGCLITHEHGDHAGHAKSFQESGIEICMSKGTATALELQFYTELTKYKAQNFGSFKVLSFDVEHDATEPVNFLINHYETGNILFITDCKNLNDLSFPGLEYIIIEANYTESIIYDKIWNKIDNCFLEKRIINNHLSIEKTIQFLKRTDLSKCKAIILIHLSSSNSTSDFAQMVESETRICTYIAKKNSVTYQTI